MDAKKIYTLVALAAYYNKVQLVLFRVINNALEHSSSLKEWEIRKRDNATWTSQWASSLNTLQRKLLVRELNAQGEIARKQWASTIQFVDLVVAIFLLVWSLANRLHLVITIDAKGVSTRCTKLKLRNSSLSIVHYAILQLTLENSDKEMIRIDLKYNIIQFLYNYMSLFDIIFPIFIKLKLFLIIM
jgi:hypothetical protein